MLSTGRLRTGSLTSQVCDEISRMILEGGMRPGDKLPSMADLEARFGVSHTVMREALRVLETRGLVQIQHGKGAVVSQSPSEALGLSLSTIFQLHDGTMVNLMELRTILETEVARLAAIRRNDQDLEAMEASLKRFEHPPLSTDVYIDADVAFHNALVSATYNPVLGSVINSLQWLLVESRSITFRGPAEGVTRALKAHWRIYEMVKAQDPEGAKNAMLQHLQETQEDIELAIKEGRLRKEL